MNRTRSCIRSCVAAILVFGFLGEQVNSKDTDKQRDKKCEASAGTQVGGSCKPRVTFDTGILKGSFRFFDEKGQREGLGKGDFPGVTECVYKPLGVPLINETPPNSLFLPEWLLRPKGPRDGVLWRQAFFVMPERIPHGVRVRFPDEALAQEGLRCTFDYRAIGDMLLLDGYIEATRRQTDLEIFFASYISNHLNATYAPARHNSEITWKLIPNRVEYWKSAYFICSTPETQHWRRDGRMSDASDLGDWSLVYDADWPFAAPILVALEESSGLAAIQFVDDHCTVLAGQYHPHDTAHDFAWGWHALSPGKKFHTCAAMWITQLHGSQQERMAAVYKRYFQWRNSWEK